MNIIDLNFAEAHELLLGVGVAIFLSNLIIMTKLATITQMMTKKGE